MMDAYPKIALKQFNETWTVLMRKEYPFEQHEYQIIGAGQSKEEALFQAVKSIVKTHDVLTDKIESFIKDFTPNLEFISDEFNIQPVEIPIPKELEDEGTRETNTTTVDSANYLDDDFYLDTGVFLITEGQ
jgi:hypothetical protein